MERKYMIYNFRLLVVIFVCVLTGLIYSQTINSTFERITIKDGLSNSIVSSIIQDKKGFMWFATHNGLNKYDGFTFKVYRHIANDSTSLSQNEIRKLYEDNEGNIWIVPMSSSGGLNKFDPKIEKFTRYIHNPDDTTSISSDEIFDVIQDKSGNIWVVADNALNLVVNKKTNDKT